MNFTNKIFISLQLFVALLLLPMVAQATHIVGGDMTYRCLGSNNYEITLTVYRDCNFGAANAYFDNPAYVSIFDGTANALFDTLHMAFQGIDDTLGMIDPCLEFQPNVCVHRTVYKKVINLPYSPNGYLIAYQRCCRNQTINNIQDPLQTGATYVTWLSPQAQLECNNSPTFDNWPPIYICANTPLFFDHSATDADGDSIVYKLCTPYSGATEPQPRPQVTSMPPFDTVVWIGNYNLSNLLGGTPLNINPVTGVMTAVPNTLGQFVVGVCAEEYRNGQLISITRRDFQYNVENCRATTAIFEAPQAQCDNLTVQFTNNSINADNFLWYFGDPANPTATSTAQNPSFTYSDTGTYTITLIVEPGDICVDTTTRQVFLQNNSLNTDFNYTVSNCTDSIVINAADISTDNFSPVNQWTWTLNNAMGNTLSSSTTKDTRFVVQNSGTYVLTLSVRTQNGCVGTISKTISVVNIQDSLAGDSILACNNNPIALNPSFTPGARYVWSPIIGLSNPNAANPTVIPTQDITYSVVISDSMGLCSVTKQITLLYENGAPNLTPLQNICTDQVALVAANSDPTYNYIWATSPTFANVISVTPSFMVTPTPGGTTYYVRVTTPSGCFYQDSTTINANAVDVNINGPDTLGACQGENFVWSITNTDPTDINTYIWTPNDQIISGNGTPAINVNTMTVGTYEFAVTAINQFGCADTDTATLVVLNNPRVDYVAGAIECDGLTICFQNTSVNAGLYLWNFGDGATSTQINPCHTFPDTGRYQVMLTVGADVPCSDTIVQEIYLPGPINNAAFTYGQFDCTPTAATLGFQDVSTLQTPITTRQWIFVSSNGTTQTSDAANPTLPITANQTITAYYVVTLTNGCVDTAVQTIEARLIDITYPTDVVYACENMPTPLNPNGNPNLQYIWSPANAVDNPTSFNPTGNPAVATLYTVQITDPVTGCVVNDTVDLLPIDNVNLDFSYQQDCNSLAVNFANLSQNAPFYFWLFGDPSISTSTGTSPTFVYPDTGTYAVTLTLNIGAVCNATVVKNIRVERPLQADFNWTTFDCAPQATINFNNTTVGGTNTTYNWIFSDNQTSTAASPSITTTTTPLTATMIATSANGCSDTLLRTLNLNLFTVSLPDTLLYCVGSQPIALNPNGEPSYTYQWSPATGLDDPNSYNPVASPTTSTAYSVTITSPGIVDTCEVVRTVFVRVSNSMQDLTASNDTLTCGSPINISAFSANAATYTWYANGNVTNTGATVSVNPTQTTTYTVVVQDNIGCTAAEEVVVANRAVTIGFEQTPAFCEGTAVPISIMNFDPSDNLTYNWQPAANIVSGGNTANPVILGTGSFVITVTATNQFGCSATVTSPVIANSFGANLTATATPDTIVSGQSSQLNVTVGNSFTYAWSPDSTLTVSNIFNPTANPTRTTTYTVTVTDNNGCFDTRNVTVYVLPSTCEEPFIFIPNAFTPNDDGENDVLYVRANNIRAMELYIYNRWGEKVFESFNQGTGWDGTFNGKKLPPDVYGFYLKAFCINNEQFVKQGNITLLR